VTLIWEHLAATVAFCSPGLPRYRQNSASRATGFVLPKFDSAPTKYSWESSLRRNAVLAQTLIALDVATPEDWRNAEGAPRKLVQDSLQRWLAQQGSEVIARQFELSMSLVDSLDFDGRRA